MANSVNDQDLYVKLQGPAGELVDQFPGRITSNLQFNDLNLCVPSTLSALCLFVAGSNRPRFF